MRTWKWIGLLFALLVSLAGCGQGGSSAPSSSHGGPANDYVSLIDHLRAAGATVVPVGSVKQSPLSGSGYTITVNGASVQVYEYADSTAAASDGTRISPSGDSIDKTKVDWTGTPHFYTTGKIIVLYLGSDTAMMHLLTTVIGNQFAGASS